MERKKLLEKVRHTLQDSGFEISREAESKSFSFDIIARKDETLLILKVLSNMDSQSQISANELKTLGFFLKGIPLTIGDRSTQGDIETGVLYLRHGVTVMNVDTFNEFLIQGVPPVAFSAPGGFFVEIDGEKLKSQRETQGLSLGDLSRKVGVSRKSIQMYEGGRSASIDVGLKIEDILNTRIIQPLNPLGHIPEESDVEVETTEIDSTQMEVYTALKDIGYDVRPAGKCPFDAYTHKTPSVILTVVGDLSQRVQRRLRTIVSISEIAKKDALLVTDSDKPKDLDIPTIKKNKLKSIEDPQEFLEIIKNH